MKTPMLSIFVLFIFTLFICTLFINDNQADSNIVLDGGFFDSGRVLGVSEAAAELPVKQIYFNLYDQAKIDKINDRPSIPQKVGTEAEPELPLGRGAVLDAKSGALLFGRYEEERAPIASITKLATALVFLDTEPDWEKVYEINPSDRVEGGIM